MKLVLCSILMLLLTGCASVVADQPGVNESAAVAESQEAGTIPAEMMELLDLLANQELMIEALQGEIAALQEGGADYGYVYEVRPGQSLWIIADEIYGDPYRWVTIYSMSCFLMDSPDLIYPGQVLLLP